jgi:hypothetical protein
VCFLLLPSAQLAEVQEAFSLAAQCAKEPGFSRLPCH